MKGRLTSVSSTLESSCLHFSDNSSRATVGIALYWGRRQVRRGFRHQECFNNREVVHVQEVVLLHVRIHISRHALYSWNSSHTLLGLPATPQRSTARQDDQVGMVDFSCTRYGGVFIYMILYQDENDSLVSAGCCVPTIWTTILSNIASFQDHALPPISALVFANACVIPVVLIETCITHYLVVTDNATLHNDEESDGAEPLLREEAVLE